MRASPNAPSLFTRVGLLGLRRNSHLDLLAPVLGARWEPLIRANPSCPDRKLLVFLIGGLTPRSRSLDSGAEPLTETNRRADGPIEVPGLLADLGEASITGEGNRLSVASGLRSLSSGWPTSSRVAEWPPGSFSSVRAPPSDSSDRPARPGCWATSWRRRPLLEVTHSTAEPPRRRAYIVARGRQKVYTKRPSG